MQWIWGVNSAAKAFTTSALASTTPSSAAGPNPTRSAKPPTFAKREAFKTAAQVGRSTAALRVHVDAANTTSRARSACTQDNARDPGTQPASSTVASPHAGMWNTVALSGASVTKGQSYWIAILQPEGTSGTIKFRDAPHPDGDDAQT